MDEDWSQPWHPRPAAKTDMAKKNMANMRAKKETKKMAKKKTTKTKTTTLKRPAAVASGEGPTKKTTADSSLIKMGSDCTGLNSMALALEQMQLSHKFVDTFASDALPECRKFLKANFKDLHDDNIFERCDHKVLNKLGKISLYSSGFPCQPFSKSGKRLGVHDGERGIVIVDIIQTITATRPDTFLLENVEGLKSEHIDTLAAIIDSLKSILDSKYRVSWKCLNSKTHSGIPQNRARILIVGIDKAIERKNVRFRWPGTIETTSVEQYLDPYTAANRHVDYPVGSKTCLANLLGSTQKVLARGGRCGVQNINWFADIWSGHKAMNCELLHA